MLGTTHCLLESHFKVEQTRGRKFCPQISIHGRSVLAFGLGVSLWTLPHLRQPLVRGSLVPSLAPALSNRKGSLGQANIGDLARVVVENTIGSSGRHLCKHQLGMNQVLLAAEGAHSQETMEPENRSTCGTTLLDVVTPGDLLASPASGDLLVSLGPGASGSLTVVAGGESVPVGAAGAASAASQGGGGAAQGEGDAGAMGLPSSAAGGAGGGSVTSKGSGAAGPQIGSLRPGPVGPADKSELASNSQKTNIFVFQIPLYWSEQDLLQHFSECGTVTSVRVERKSGGRNRGYGFVCFSDPKSAQQAVERMDGQVFDGKKLQVSLKRPRKETAGQLPAEMYPRTGTSKGTKCSLFVFHVPPNWRDEELQKHFETYGRCASAVVVRRRDGSSKGYGFVDFEDAESALCALQLASQEVVEGKRLKVLLKTEPKRRGFSGNHFNRQGSWPSGNGGSGYLPQQGEYGLGEQRPPTGGRRGQFRSQEGGRGRPGGVFPDREGELGQIANKGFVRRPEAWRGGRGGGASRGGGKYGKPECTVFIFHVPPEWNDGDLKRHFRHFGRIRAATVQRDDDGQSRGFGFISFETPSSAHNAVAGMNGFHTGSKYLKVMLKSISGGNAVGGAGSAASKAAGAQQQRADQAAHHGQTGMNQAMVPQQEESPSQLGGPSHAVAGTHTPWLAPPPPPHHVAAVLMHHAAHSAASSGSFPAYCEGSLPNYPQHQAHHPPDQQHGPSSSGLVTVAEPVYSMAQGIPAGAARNSNQTQATAGITGTGLGVGHAGDHQQGGGNLVGPLIVPGASSAYMQHIDGSGHAIVRDSSVSDGGLGAGTAYGGVGVGSGVGAAAGGTSGALHRSKPKGGEGDGRRSSGRVPHDGSNTSDQA
ncbi:rna recognition motif-containing protein [Cystoisospora suis]|uniref:Rna recognition motif-containing protein n=1 Tax=Cystoisospora suis TaxID=483139 RepID=A0A2C6LEW7_9APIC|nr:rna recognition motif-containing protein [Cystoisospora suis]